MKALYIHTHTCYECILLIMMRITNTCIFHYFPNIFLYIFPRYLHDVCMVNNPDLLQTSPWILANLRNFCHDEGFPLRMLHTAVPPAAGAAHRVNIYEAKGEDLGRTLVMRGKKKTAPLHLRCSES